MDFCIPRLALPGLTTNGFRWRRSLNSFKCIIPTNDPQSLALRNGLGAVFIDCSTRSESSTSLKRLFSPSSEQKLIESAGEGFLTIVEHSALSLNVRVDDSGSHCLEFWNVKDWLVSLPSRDAFLLVTKIHPT
jgi:hypothetical protein